MTLARYRYNTLNEVSMLLRIYHKYSTIYFVLLFPTKLMIDSNGTNICIPLGSRIIHSKTVESVTGTDQDPTLNVQDSSF